MRVHTCEAAATDEGYVGIGVPRGARVASAGHGGQVLLSQATRELLEDGPDSLGLRDLGEHRLKDLTQPPVTNSSAQVTAWLISGNTLNRRATVQVGLTRVGMGCNWIVHGHVTG